MIGFCADESRELKEQSDILSRVETARSGKGISYFHRFNCFWLNFKKVTTSNWLELLAKFYGDYPVVQLDQPMSYPFFSGNSLGYCDLLKFVHRAGNAFLKLGIGKGDRVLIVPTNRIELALLNFACIRIGAIAVPVNFMFTAREIEYIIKDCAPKALITDQEVYSRIFSSEVKIPELEHLLLLEEDVPSQAKSLCRLMAESEEHFNIDPGLKLNEPAQIFYTSGTTGFPKGALITHLNLLYFIRAFSALGALYPWRGKELLITSLPLAHIMGMMLLLIRICGKTRWYFLNRFDPEKTLDLLEKKRGTAFIGVPAMFSMLKDVGVEKRNLSSVLLWGSAADRMAPELVEYFQKIGYRKYIFPVFVEMYGQVETSGAVTVKATFPWSKPRTGSVGMPFPWVKFRVVKDDGSLAKPGETGELEIRGPMVSPGYWKREGKAEGAPEKVWHQTGDIVRRGRFRTLYFVARKSERIKCKGYSIFPAEVEQELSQHPAIKEVAVLGIPDEKIGEIPVAVVTLSSEAKITSVDLLQWAKENIALYKCPRQIKIIKEMPRGSTQKVLKRELVKLFQPEIAPEAQRRQK